jgi:hypothetical protein
MQASSRQAEWQLPGKIHSTRHLRALSNSWLVA